MISRVKGKIANGVAMIFAACLLGLAIHIPAAAGENSRELLKNQVISLVEDRLSQALSFKRRGELPDFSTLDEIYPSWDHGNPGKARRTWVQRNWFYHKVGYRVDSVELSSQFTARVRGKKRVRYGHDVDFLVMFDREEKVDSSTHFVMDLYRDAKGRWFVRAESEF